MIFNNLRFVAEKLLITIIIKSGYFTQKSLFKNSVEKLLDFVGKNIYM